MIHILDILQIGNKIRELRKERGLTQQAFAQALHVSFQAVSNWERGIAPPDLENLIGIASYFGILVDDLLRQKTEKLILGIDGGGSKTAFAVTTTDGHVLEFFCRNGCNPNDVGLQKALKTICDGISEILVKFPSVSAVFCGIAGVSTGDHGRRMLQSLKEAFPSLTIGVKTDSANLFAMDDEADMAVISGTGSVVFVRNGEGYARLGGWGYLFDRAGSAYDIGRDAVMTALEEEERMEKPSLVSELLRETLKTAKAWDAVGSLYEGGKPLIASLAKVVFQGYGQGDAKAADIIDRNAARLAELLNTGVRLYRVRPRAVAGGGLFEHYGDILRHHLSKHTDVEIVTSELPPIYGACRQSRRLLGDGVPQDFYRNFKNSYKGWKK
ncbi:MAG: XRE family transcriptional regulator [Clostridia bacterium]|nr:XRE family transcriptional regulator [Clostridia bacterium]